MIVEDDPRVLRLLHDLLVYEGYTVATATDGEEGLETFKAGAFDVIVTDVKMPKMDGIEMMKAIKALDPGVEVIVLTGYGTLDMTIDVLRNGGYDFLKKPDEIPGRIRASVQRALEKRRLTLKNQELVKALEEANARLEARVQEKTAELEQINQQLEDTLLTLADINQTLREASFIDEATGLFNRQYFEEHIHEDVARARRYHWNFALVLFEFTAEDQPDTARVRLSDEDLHRLADIVKSDLREGDIIARYDDDRFVLMLPQLQNDAYHFCERIKMLIETQADHFEHTIAIRCGVAFCPDDSRSAEMLFMTAERALEQSQEYQGG